MRIALQPAYVLHSRPYRDSSLLLEVLTAEHGRLSLVGKGSRRRSRGGSSSALLQPFVPLLLSFSGRGELKNLTGVEAAGSPVGLREERLFSGLYINELLVRLLHRHDPHPRLFASYGRALSEMATAESTDTILRCFELFLLEELGYSFSLTEDGHSGERVVEDRWYQYQPDVGLSLAAEGVADATAAYCGADLLRMAAGEFDGEARLTSKRLMRQALAHHLGDKPLKSRDLFRSATRENSSGGNR